MNEHLKTETYTGMVGSFADTVNLSAMIDTVVLVILTFRLFKYLNVTLGMSPFVRTIDRATPDLLAFFVVYWLTFVGFAIALYVAYSDRFNTFNSIGRSILYLTQCQFGFEEYETLAVSSSYFTPAFFILYIFIFSFVAYNLFLAAILNSFRFEIEASGSGSSIYKVIASAFGRFRKFLLAPREWCKKCSACCSRSKKEDFMPNLQVLSRLADWKAKKDNVHVMFLNFKMIKAALQGDLRDFIDVPNAQVKFSLDYGAAQENEILKLFIT